jgi:hypothetical protein
MRLNVGRTSLFPFFDETRGYREKKRLKKKKDKKRKKKKKKKKTGENHIQKAAPLTSTSRFVQSYAHNSS